MHERAAGGTQQTVAAPGVALPPLINLINRFNICPSHRAQDTHIAQLGFAHACHVMHQVEWSGVEWSGVELSILICYQYLEECCILNILLIFRSSSRLTAKLSAVNHMLSAVHRLLTTVNIIVDCGHCTG